MAYKLIKGKNKIRGEQTFINNITGSVISASSYVGGTFSGSTINATNGLYTSLTSSAISASNYYGINADIQIITGSTITGSTLLSTNITGNYAQLINLSGTTAQYTTISGSHITGSDIKTTTLSASFISASQIFLTEYLDFNTASVTPTYRQGRFFYNTAENTFDPAFFTSVSGVSLNLGQQTAVKVKNTSGLQISKGKVVRITGGEGANPTISTASWENDNNSANTLGMAMNDMNQNDFGFVLLNGVITGINTENFSAGDIIYLSSSGNITNIKPQAPIHLVKIGEVIRVQQNNGSMFINIDNGYEVEELHDVRVISASAGDLLVRGTYNGSPIWVNSKTLSGSYVITGSLTISSSATFTNIGPAVFSGTINATNTISGTTAEFTNISASSIIVNGSPISGFDTGSLITTASVSDATITFTKGDGSTFFVVINNVTNVTSASFANNSATASFMDGGFF